MKNFLKRTFLRLNEFDFLYFTLFKYSNARKVSLLNCWRNTESTQMAKLNKKDYEPVKTMKSHILSLSLTVHKRCHRIPI